MEQLLNDPWTSAIQGAAIILLFWRVSTLEKEQRVTRKRFHWLIGAIQRIAIELQVKIDPPPEP